MLDAHAIFRPVGKPASRTVSAGHGRGSGKNRASVQARPGRDNNGFTLIEVVIALAIFATLTAALISISNSLNIISSLRAYQVSAWVADNHIEFARIDGLEKNLSYTTTLFGTEYISKIKPLKKPYIEKFEENLEERGKITASASAPQCRQVFVMVYREYASEPEFKMLSCLFPPPSEQGESGSNQ